MEGNIIMNRKEFERVKVLEKIMNQEISQVEGAKLMEVSDRQVRRIREGGMRNIIHQGLHYQEPPPRVPHPHTKSLCRCNQRHSNPLTYHRC